MASFPATRAAIPMRRPGCDMLQRVSRHQTFSTFGTLGLRGPRPFPHEDKMNNQNPTAGAIIQMPTMQEMAGPQPRPKPPFIRIPVFPTAPYIPTNPNVGIQTRFYGATLTAGDADYVVGSEAIRIVSFDMPCILFARTGSVFNTVPPNALPLGVRPLDAFLFRMEYSTGDKLDTGPRIASTCIGSNENPGEIGGTGYVIQPGAGVILGITPLLPGLRIDITLMCQEIRGPTNYTR